MFKINSIFVKTLLSIFFTIFFFSVVSSIFYITNQKKEILKSIELEVKSIAKMIVFSTSDAIVLDDGSFIVEFGHEFVNKNDLIESIIINRQDKDFFFTTKENWRYLKSLDKKFTSLEKETPSYEIMYDNIIKKDVFHYTYPIEFSGTKWGYVHISFSLKEYDKKLDNMYYVFTLFFCVLLLIIFIVSFLIAKSFSKPIVNLSLIANAVSHGNFDQKSEYEGSDEIGQLSRNFNKMISRVKLSQEQLKESYEQLEDRVDERTVLLNKTNKILEQKTNELEYLNEILDNKVKEEVEKRTSQERLLIQQSRLAAMGEMIGNIAHQWRQPLSIISTAASGIKVEKEFNILTDESELKKIDTIIKTSSYLSNTIEDFSNFFKPNKKRETFFIDKKVEQSLELVGSSLNFHHIEVNEEINDEIEIYGYPNEYAQAVLNLLTNAKDALVERAVENPSIYVRVYKENGFGILEIEDNGGGISQEIMDKIFDPYFTTKHKSQGTGIGLYMSKTIIEENMNGLLRVRNGQNGAIFKISLPLA